MRLIGDGAMSLQSRASPSALPSPIEPLARYNLAARCSAQFRHSIVIVPTPSNVLGGFSLKYVPRVCGQIGGAAQDRRARGVDR
jgi:hypothetical protein